MTIDSQDCFMPLLHKAQRIVDHANRLITENTPWVKHFGFDAIPINSCWIQKEPVLAFVNAIAPIKQLGLLRVSSLSMYDWHVDQYRLSCINLLISQNHLSHTLFSKQRDELNKDICELVYQPNTYYLFNNQVSHCVINLDGPRYLVSLYFEEEIPYEELKRLFIQNKLC